MAEYRQKNNGSLHTLRIVTNSLDSRKRFCIIRMHPKHMCLDLKKEENELNHEHEEGGGGIRLYTSRVQMVYTRDFKFFSI